MTIHKSQGLTLDQIWIDLGKSERTPGLSYVALSRARNIKSLMIEPLSFERLDSLKDKAYIQKRKREEERLKKHSI